MKLSICVPIYGTEKYIERCARSLFNQGNGNVEYIFVNDCTKDKSIQVLQEVADDYPKLKENIRIINHTKNLGLAGARLTGLQNSTGDYVWFVDSDDYVQNNAIVTLLPYMEEKYDLIAFNYFYDKGNDISRFTEKAFTITNVLLNIVSPSIWKCVIRRRLFFDNNILPVVGINVSEDYLLLARLILVSKKKVFLDSQYLYYYELDNEGSYLHNPSIKSLENTADAVVLVSKFYMSMNSAKKYKSALSIKNAMTYFCLAKVSPNNGKCEKLLNTIKEIDTFIYIIIKLLGLKLSEKIVYAYRKYIIGGVFRKLHEAYYKSSSKRFITMLRSHHVLVGKNVVFRSPRSTHIDLTRPSLITIGNNVDINVNFHLYTHDWTSFVFRQVFHDFVNSSGRVKIGDNVYIAANVIILKGVSIGNNCIIGAGSVVTKDIPSNSVAVGNPCRVLCTLEEFYERRKKKALNEAKEYADSIRERYQREPEAKDFWEEFGYFVDAKNRKKYPEIPIEAQLAQGYCSWIRNHHAQFDGLDAFLDFISKND